MANAAREWLGDRWAPARSERTPLGLRARATIAFGVVGLFAAAGLATGTYVVARSYLLDQRQDSAEQQAFVNARLTRSALRSVGVDVTTLLTTIRGEAGSDVVLRYQGDWYSSSVAVGQDSVPTGLRQVVGAGHAGHKLVRTRGDLQLVVGTPIAAVDASYFEVFPLGELERTLSVLRNVLVVGAVLMSMTAAALGRYAADRVLRPLGPVAAAAERIAGGDLGTRLPGGGDPDLAPLTAGFNTMAASLQERIDHEVRFVSDVSHELRSPLAVLRAAVDVIDRRRVDLPEGIDDALDIIGARLESFEALVLDLLEISRFDADAVTLQAEPLVIAEFLAHTLARHGLDDVVVHLDIDGGAELVGDRRRLAQAIGNIADNARIYAGGLTAVTAIADETQVSFMLDDDGPGVDPSERTAIVQRFARGGEGRRAGPASGTGLGLALTVAHLGLHGGDLTVTDAPSGGARFIIRLPRGGVT